MPRVVMAIRACVLCGRRVLCMPGNHAPICVDTALCERTRRDHGLL